MTHLKKCRRKPRYPLHASNLCQQVALLCFPYLPIDGIISRCLLSHHTIAHTADWFDHHRNIFDNLRYIYIYSCWCKSLYFSSVSSFMADLKALEHPTLKVSLTILVFLYKLHWFLQLPFSFNWSHNKLFILISGPIWSSEQKVQSWAKNSGPGSFSYTNINCRTWKKPI